MHLAAKDTCRKGHSARDTRAGVLGKRFHLEPGVCFEEAVASGAREPKFFTTGPPLTGVGQGGREDRALPARPAPAELRL